MKVWAVALAALTLLGCKKTEAPPPPAPLVTVADLQRLHARIQPDHPGRGVTDYPGNTAEDVPKSYAMVLLGDIERHRHRAASALPELGAIAGRWLLAHADENRDGVIGWGVPVAWDAYGDGSVNPKDTEYSISTAIVIDALLTWREAGAGTADPEILPVVERAAEPYLRHGVLTPSGLLPYSLRESDRPYDTFNSAAYLAGQLQRLSKLTTDARLAARLAEVADKTVASLLKNRQTSPDTGAWYWRYSIQEATPNDLPHASYIVLGLRDYVAHDGRLAPQVDMAKVVDHLREFTPDDKQRRETGMQVRAWPRFSKDIVLPARSYDLGIAMHLACSDERLEPLRKPLVEAVPGYRNATGAYQKYPVASEEPPLVVAEYESYLYRGLATCLVAGSRPGELLPERPEPPVAITPATLATVQRAIARRAPATDVQMPFVLPATVGAPAVQVRYAPGRAQTRLELPGGAALALPASALPVALIGEAGSHAAVVTRAIPDGELALAPIGERRLGKAVAIRHAPDRQPIFRAAVLHQGVADLVYYDNPTQANYLVRFERRGEAFERLGEAIKLPSLQDPAGSTYEMIPRLDFVAEGKRLWLVGGTLLAEVAADGHIIPERLAGCSRAVEVVATARGPVALCVAAQGSGAPYVLAGPTGLALPPLDAAKGLPWNLRPSGDSVAVDYASSPQDLAAVLRRDLEHGQQGGWFELGIGNEEGRIPWSQIYYLNGYLDALALARRDEAAAAVFGPLLAAIRQRLDLEMQLLDERWRTGRYRTRAFTVDRSLALFAVQSSRLLLLMDRYRKEVPDPVSLPAFADVQRSVRELRGHIDVLAYSGEDPRWLKPGTPHLRWPKGSKFYFDGVAVPYNHQNEWAYSVLRSAPAGQVTRQDGALSAALGILGYFVDQVAPGGVLPVEGEWNYWWGKAYDGWTEAEGISVNKPSYPGDHSKAWISFRSIDTMSTLAYAAQLPVPERERLIASAARLVYEGKLYPFVAYELHRQQRFVLPSRDVALRYARVSAPWELQSATWALARLAQREAVR